MTHCDDSVHQFFGYLRFRGVAGPSGFLDAMVIGSKGFGLVLAVICLPLEWTPPSRYSCRMVPASARPRPISCTLANSGTLI